jgi:hypothetical protein
VDTKWIKLDSTHHQLTRVSCKVDNELNSLISFSSQLSDKREMREGFFFTKAVVLIIIIIINISFPYFVEGGRIGEKDEGESPGTFLSLPDPFSA